MRLLRYVGALLVVALAATGIAIAAGGHGQPKTDAVQATFTATPDAGKTKTRTCTGADGTYNETDGTYTGTATSSDPRLNGPFKLRTHTLVNTTTGFGTTRGKVRLRGTGHNHSEAKLVAVNTQNGKLDGFLVGNVHGGSPGTNGHLFANFTAAFNNDGSVLSGELGTDAPVAPTNSAVVQSGHCHGPHPHPAKPPKPHHH